MQVSIVKKSNIVSDFRIDAELYQPHYFEIEKTLKLLIHTNIGEEVSVFKKGIFDINAECYSARGIPFVRISNLKNMIIDESGIVFIPEEENKKYLNTLLQKNDIILSKTAYPAASLVTLDLCNTSQDTIAIKLKSSSRINSHFFVVFMNSKYGSPQMRRWFTGNIQMHLNLKDSRQIIIPVLSNDFQNNIKKVFFYSVHILKNAHQVLKKTEHILLSELGLTNWRPKHRLSFVKNYSNVQQTERIDAEYFQPKYDEIVDAIKTYKGGWDTLGNLVKIKKSIEPGSDAYQESGVPFVRVSNLSKHEITNNNQKYISEELYQDLIKYQPKQNEILLSKDATPGIAFHLKEKPDRMIPSGGILRLTVRNRERSSEEYLTLVLNSTLVQQQILRDAGGSIIKHWRLDQVKNTLIPILGKEKQKEIKSKIEDSFDCRKKSKQLLEIAKQGVEMAIEQDEAMAKEWIQMQIQNLDINLNDEE